MSHPGSPDVGICPFFKRFICFIQVAQGVQRHVQQFLVQRSTALIGARSHNGVAPPFGLALVIVESHRAECTPRPQ